MLPQLSINLQKIKHNAQVIMEACQKRGVEVVGVTKGCLGDPRVAKSMLEGGVLGLADSRLQNLKKLANLNPPLLMLLRAPMKEEFRLATKIASVSLISTFEAASGLSQAALTQGKPHHLILMVETGNLREGVPLFLLEEVISQILKLKGVRLIGVGTNPPYFPEKFDPSDLKVLAAEAKKIGKKFNLPLKVVSGGGSNCLKLVEEGTLPQEINQLRIGEGILLGKETLNFEAIVGTYQDAFLIKAEVIEVYPKEESSSPPPLKLRRASRARVVVALGRQDVAEGELKPLDSRFKVLKRASCHLVLEQKGRNSLKEGETLDFIPSYFALLASMASPFVHRKYLD